MARKGHTNNPNGRVKGVPNKTTKEFKQACTNLIDYATPRMVDWLDKIAQDDPDKALKHVYNFAQFGYPLLSRRDQNTTHDVSDRLAESWAKLLEKD